MADRSIILVADAGVAIEGGLTLLPGYYRAVKRRIEGPTHSKRRFTDAEYLIEMSGRQIVAMGGTLGAAGLISADVDVTRQVCEGLFRLSDRRPAPLARRAFAEYRPRGISTKVTELRMQGVQKLADRTWKRVKTDLAECFRRALREFKAALLSFPGYSAMKLRSLQREKMPDFIEHFWGFAVPNVVGKLSQFFSSPISGAFNVYANKFFRAQHLRCPVFREALQLHVLVRLRTMYLWRSHTD